MATKKTITRTEIIGTSMVVFEAWEKYNGHSTIRTIHNTRFGRVGSRRLPDELEALEHGSDERIRRVIAWQRSEDAEAYRAIRAMYSIPASAKATLGEITLYT